MASKRSGIQEVNNCILRNLQETGAERMTSDAILSLLLLALRRRRRQLSSKKFVGSRFKFREQRIKFREQRRRIMRLYWHFLRMRRISRNVKSRKQRRWWVRPLLAGHEVHGAWFSSIPIMRERFYRTFRMTPEAFEELLILVEPFVKKNSWRKPICPGERLAITLRYLASGDNFESLELFFLVAHQTISNIVFETTTVLWNVLRPLVFQPITEDTWLQKAAEFEAMWNLPHCVGAIDGKHVRIQAPPRSGSKCFNYKAYFSTILMAVCDAKKKFIMVDVGSSGRRGDGNVFHKSQFAKNLVKGELNLPPPCLTEGIDVPLPFYFVGDAAFKRGNNLLTPFKGKRLPEYRKLFNYRVSRARGNIEATFGILCHRYGVLDTPMKVSFACTKSVVLACCALHNFHMMREDSIAASNKTTKRNKNEDSLKELIALERLYASVTSADLEDCGESLEGEAMSEALTDFFIKYELPWQWRSAHLC